MSRITGMAEEIVIGWAQCETCKTEYEDITVILHNGWAEFECPHCGMDSEIHDLNEGDE